MRRRLDLAMSLVGNPPLLFLDEPTTGLDPEARNAVWDMVRELKRGGATIMLTTQYLEEADQLADSIAILHKGKIAVEGSPAELKNLLPQATTELVVKQPTLDDVFFSVIEGNIGGKTHE
jgi:ABC-2 type transport system ATP-binding protein